MQTLLQLLAIFSYSSPSSSSTQQTKLRFCNDLGNEDGDDEDGSGLHQEEKEEDENDKKLRLLQITLLMMNILREKENS